MTDNEIIELLNECDTTHIKIQCVESILSDTRGVIHLDLSKIVDILNRQKAEIERLEDLNKCYYTSCQQIAKSNHEIKAKAVKEVVKQLEAEVESSDKYIREYEDTEKQRYWNIGLRHALKVVKRMAGADGD